MKIIKQMAIGDNTLLILNDRYPFNGFNTVVIDKIEYKPEVVYGIRDSIAIKGKGLFEGKDIEFVHR